MRKLHSAKLFKLIFNVGNIFTMSITRIFMMKVSPQQDIGGWWSKWAEFLVVCHFIKRHLELIERQCGVKSPFCVINAFFNIWHYITIKK